MVRNFFDTFIKQAHIFYDKFLHEQSSLNWKYVVSSAVVAIFVVAWKSKKIKKPWTRLLRYLKTKRYRQEIFKDLKLIFFKYFIFKTVVIILFGVNAFSLGPLLKDFLSQYFGQTFPLFHLDYDYGPIFKILVLVAIVDCASYFAHRWSHHIQTLWLFHRTHHRATALNPLSRLREHPLDYFYIISSTAILSAPFIFAFDLLYDVPITEKDFLIKVGILFVTYMGLNHLRHSHVRVHYPRFLSYVLMSPAMHQIHHSIEKRHLNKNFGVMFSVWDGIFGTLYIPEKQENFKYGIAEEKNQILSASEELLEPFEIIYGNIKKRMTKETVKIKKFQL